EWYRGVVWVREVTDEQHRDSDVREVAGADPFEARAFVFFRTARESRDFQLCPRLGAVEKAVLRKRRVTDAGQDSDAIEDVLAHPPDVVTAIACAHRIEPHHHETV